MLGRAGVAHYGRRCSWAHSEGHIGVAHYGILVGGPLQLRWQPIGRRCLWAHLGEVPTDTILQEKGKKKKTVKSQFFYSVFLSFEHGLSSLEFHEGYVLLSNIQIKFFFSFSFSNISSY